MFGGGVGGIPQTSQSFKVDLETITCIFAARKSGGSDAYVI